MHNKLLLTTLLSTLGLTCATSTPEAKNANISSAAAGDSKSALLQGIQDYIQDVPGQPPAGPVLACDSKDIIPKGISSLSKYKVICLF